MHTWAPVEPRDNSGPVLCVCVYKWQVFKEPDSKLNSVSFFFNCFGKKERQKNENSIEMTVANYDARNQVGDNT